MLQTFLTLNRRQYIALAAIGSAVLSFVLKLVWPSLPFIDRVGLFGHRLGSGRGRRFRLGLLLGLLLCLFFGLLAIWHASTYHPSHYIAGWIGSCYER